MHIVLCGMKHYRVGEPITLLHVSIPLIRICIKEVSKILSFLVTIVLPKTKMRIMQKFSGIVYKSLT